MEAPEALASRFRASPRQKESFDLQAVWDLQLPFRKSARSAIHARLQANNQTQNQARQNETESIAWRALIWHASQEPSPLCFGPIPAHFRFSFALPASSAPRGVLGALAARPILRWGPSLGDGRSQTRPEKKSRGAPGREARSTQKKKKGKRQRITEQVHCRLHSAIV